jgi:mannose-6-phosphate isomerase-like protein (cupin superfamily)
MHLSKRHAATFIPFLASASYLPLLHGQERRPDPTFLHAETATAAEKPSDITTGTCHYKPLFGDGASKFRGSSLARYGEAVVDPNGACTAVQYPLEDQIYVVLDGSGSARYGSEDVPLKKEDFLYIPATVEHALTNKSSAPLTVLIMGFSTKGYDANPLPAQPLVANIEDVPIEHVGGHPESTHYRLLMTDPDDASDPSLYGKGTIVAGRVVTNLFLMEIDPGGTNNPHHHEREEELYQLLSGQGDQVAGGGVDGVEGRYPAKPGDAYFVRANGTIGFYSASGVHSRVLCARWWYPGLQQRTERGEGH